MSLKIALQMDPPHLVNIAGDSSFAIGIEAQSRGYQLYYYRPTDLNFDNQKGVSARVQSLKFQADASNPAILGEVENINLTEFDVILMRQDPPFDMGYITATHILESVSSKVLVLNNPKEVRDAPEKLWVMDQFSEFMPRTLISRDLDALQEFHREFGEIILKPLYGNGGFGILYLGKNDPNLSASLELFFAIDNLPIIAQQYLPNIAKGDKRIILIDGELGGAINRLPVKGQVRSNLHVGGQATPSDLTTREYEICEALKPELKKRGLLFTGIDIIDNHLTEINITSPTGIVEINHFNHCKLEADIWNAIENKLK